jgi:hypothetical protein
MSAWRGVLSLLKERYAGRRFVMPRVGSGLAGGDWSRIRAALEEVLGDEEVWVVNLD